MRLIRTGPEGSETLVPEGENVVIGRAPHRGLTVVDSTISREHARLFLRDGSWNVADLNSSNGTFVNGERVTRAVLKPGDVLRLGSIDLRVEADPSGAAAQVGASSASGETSAGGITLEEAEHLFDEPPDATQAAAPRPRAPEARPPRPPVSTAPLRSGRASTTRGGKVSVMRADLAQYGFLPRLLLIVIAIAVAYGAFVFVSRVTEDVVPESAPPAEHAPDNGDAPRDDN